MFLGSEGTSRPFCSGFYREQSVPEGGDHNFKEFGRSSRKQEVGHLLETVVPIKCPKNAFYKPENMEESYIGEKIYL